MTPDAPRRSAPTIGVDVGGGKVALGAVTGDGEVIRSRRYATRAERGPDAIIDELVESIRDLSIGLPDEPARVGVGICGQVDVRSGVVRTAPNLRGWQDVRLRDRLETALGVRVAIANDVSVIALAEWSYGLGRGINDLVVVFVGTGVGAGVVSDGRPLAGDRGYAGEIGHTTIVVDGRRCTCGNRGCLEAYVGGWAIAERAREAVGRDPRAGKRMLELAGDLDAIRSETVAAANAEGDALARRLVAETGHHFGAGMVGVVNTFNPRRLAVGGGVVDGIPELLPMVADHVRKYALEASTNELEIDTARLGPEAGIVGAALFARRYAPRGRATVAAASDDGRADDPA